MIRRPFTADATAPIAVREHPDSEHGVGRSPIIAGADGNCLAGHDEHPETARPDPTDDERTRQRGERRRVSRAPEDQYGRTPHVQGGTDAANAAVDQLLQHSHVPLTAWPDPTALVAGRVKGKDASDGYRFVRSA